MQIESYPKVYALGHRVITDLLLDDVVIQEKVDGSQFSFQQISTEDGDRHLLVQSHGAEIDPSDPPQMFARAVSTVVDLFNTGQLENGFIYRAEVIDKPHHNALTYARVPKGNLILFDVQDAPSSFSLERLVNESDRLGLERVPTFFTGKLTSSEELIKLLETESILGGVKIEGVVIKNYMRFAVDGKALMGKFVSEAYKEARQKEWKVTTKVDVVAALIAGLTTEARFNKAIQYLDEQGLLVHEPKDIGLLVQRIQEDVLEEESDTIKDALFQWAKPQIVKGVIRGFPQYYKERLAKEQFNE